MLGLSCKLVASTNQTKAQTILTAVHRTRHTTKIRLGVGLWVIAHEEHPAMCIIICPAWNVCIHRPMLRRKLDTLFWSFTGIGTFTCKSANLFQDDLEFLRDDPTLSQYLPWGSESSLADTLVLECIHNMFECVCTLVYNPHQAMHRCRKSVIVE